MFTPSPYITIFLAGPPLGVILAMWILSVLG